MKNKPTLLICLTILAAMALAGHRAAAQEPFARGQGEYVYTGYEPLRDKPVTIHYYIPTLGNIKMMPILFAMHGTKRRGAETVEVWKDFAQSAGFIVICPEYSRRYYNKDEYNYGNVSKQREAFDPQPRELWTFNTVEAVFDFFREKTGNLSDRYDMWGHSAGGQFVHRYLLCMPGARVGKAVAANAGTWTFTDASQTWPYGVAGTPFAEPENLKRFYARRLYITLGTADIDTTSSDFPKYPAAMVQGGTRYERGKNFYRAAKEHAKALRCPFNWERVDVKDASHSSKMMIYGKWKIRDGRKVFSTEDVSPQGAYLLIYGDRMAANR